MNCIYTTIGSLVSGSPALTAANVPFTRITKSQIEAEGIQPSEAIFLEARRPETEIPTSLVQGLNLFRVGLGTA